jgi:hypothetical protein
MINFKLIGAAAVALMLATPAMAMHRGHHRHDAQIQRESQALGALKSRYGTAYGAYGFDRGDEFAPGNVVNDFDRKNTFN